MILTSHIIRVSYFRPKLTKKLSEIAHIFLKAGIIKTYYKKIVNFCNFQNVHFLHFEKDYQQSEKDYQHDEKDYRHSNVDSPSLHIFASCGYNLLIVATQKRKLERGNVQCQQVPS